MRKSTHLNFVAAVAALCLLTALVVSAAGCGDDNQARTQRAPRPTTLIQTVPTITNITPERQGLKLDPNLQSSSGIPSADEMKALVALQSQVPYPVMVPTSLPGGYILDTGVIGSSAPTYKDPAGYYSFKYSDPDNANRTLTFNQSMGNSRELSGYYLTETTINNVDYKVYWHRTLEYLPQGEPVRTVEVGNAETFVVVWHGTYTDTAGQPKDLYYSLTTGTWTGHGWGDIKGILESMKQLGSVAG